MPVTANLLNTQREGFHLPYALLSVSGIYLNSANFSTKPATCGTTERKIKRAFVQTFSLPPLLALARHFSPCTSTSACVCACARVCASVFRERVYRARENAHREEATEVKDRSKWTRFGVAWLSVLVAGICSVDARAHPHLP